MSEKRETTTRQQADLRFPALEALVNSGEHLAAMGGQHNQKNNVITDSTTDQYFKELLVHSPMAVYTCDLKGDITFCNPAAVVLLGTKPENEQEIWDHIWKAYYPDGGRMPADQCPTIQTLKPGADPAPVEILIESGLSFRHLLVFSQPIFNSDKEVTGLLNTLIDISSHKKDEERDAVLSAIVESSDDAIISKNLNGTITSWNRGAEKIFGYKAEETIGKQIDILIPFSLLAEEKVIIQSIRNGIKIDHYQTTRLTKSGREIPISLTVSPVKDRRGNVIGASKIARDITEQREQEEKLRQTAERLEIISSISKTISEKLDVRDILQKVTDATTQVTGAAFGAFFYNTVNSAGEALTLYTLSGAPAAAFESLEASRNTPIFADTFRGESIIRSDDITKDARYGKKASHLGMSADHQPVVSYLAVPVVSKDGIAAGGLFLGHPQPAVFKEEHESIVSSIAAQAAVALDNSELFEEVNRLNAKKDEFIALASHELKTPLTTIKSCLQIVQKAGSEEVSRLFIEKSINQADKLNVLISDLFDISKIESGKLQLVPETFDLRQLILEIIETFRYSNREVYTISLQDDGLPVTLEADRQRIEQVVINLLTNAIKYSPNMDQVYVSIERRADDHILVKIRDEGIGLSEEDQQKIFTRFYRAEGHTNISGLGLGLYLAKEIVDRHHGRIDVDSKLGMGATFMLTLPLKQPVEDKT